LTTQRGKLGKKLPKGFEEKERHQNTRQPSSGRRKTSRRKKVRPTRWGEGDPERKNLPKKNAGSCSMSKPQTIWKDITKKQDMGQKKSR